MYTISKKKTMKILDKFDSRIATELEIYFKIGHKNIVRYFDIFQVTIDEDDQSFLSIVSEYCEVIKILLLTTVLT